MMNSETFLECYGGCSLAVIACMNTVGQAIASEGDFLGGFVYFEAFYHHNMICADYATRFGDDDLVHKLACIVIGLGLLGMLVSTGPLDGPDAWIFAFCCSLTKVLLASAYMRAGPAAQAARHLYPRFHFFTTSKAVTVGFDALVWAVLGTVMAAGITVVALPKLWLFAVVAGVAIESGYKFVITTQFCWKHPPGRPPPLTLEYHVAKLARLQMLTLGAAVGLCIAACKAGAGQGYHVERLAVAALVVLFLVFEHPAYLSPSIP